MKQVKHCWSEDFEYPLQSSETLCVYSFILAELNTKTSCWTSTGEYIRLILEALDFENVLWLKSRSQMNSELLIQREKVWRESV